MSHIIIVFTKQQKMNTKCVVTSVQRLSVVVMMIKDEKNEKMIRGTLLGQHFIFAQVGTG